ncbi:MAG: hypothetical protein ACQEWI_10260 [Bacillota bacterium]
MDAVHEERYRTEEPDRIKALQKSLRFMRIGFYTAYTGLPRMLKMKVGGRFIAPDLAHYHSFIGFKPSAYEAVYKELRDSKITAEQVAECEPLHRKFSMTSFSLIINQRSV